MFLKSIKLTGFKSFADRTRLDLRPGVTVVVGPNGSGKSNVVDAVAWVMGSQSPKSLRTTKMDDVIFAGTATRPGLGRAEVTVVFDNTSGTLPLDLPEVSVTRRLYRDGSSDYEINGVGCRLLDIQELMSDSGVGKHQHVIIGQGQIATILNATAEDHRAVIEEAAGILKHRVRKDKSERRLERTDIDVTRLHDLLGELTRQMRPLKRQANAAERHDGIAAEAQALRLYLGGEDLREIRARAAEVTGLIVAANGVIGEETDALDELAIDLAKVREKAGMFGHALERDTAAAARLETTGERLRRISQVASERARTSRERLEGAVDRRNDLISEKDQLGAELEELVSKEARSESTVHEAEAVFRTLEDEERSLADQESMSTEGAIAVVRGDLRSLEAATERDNREVRSVDAQLEKLTGRIEGSRTEVQRLTEEIQDTDTLVVGAQDRFHSVQAKSRSDQETWESADSGHNEARVAVAAAKARLDAVTEAAEGLADPEARAIAEGTDGFIGTIATRLDVPDALAGAVDAALGALADSLVFDTGMSVADAIGLLKGGGRGGVSLVRSDRRTPQPDSVELPGVDWLPELLGPQADRGLATTLLGDVYVTEGWKRAWEVSTGHPEIRVVTPEGDIFAAGGVRVAHPDGATPAMLEHAQVGLERAETDLARTQSLLTQARRAFDESRATERDALETLEVLEARLTAATDTLARAERVAVEASTESDRLSDRRGSLISADESRSEQRQILQKRLANLEGEEAERQRAWEELTARRDAIAVNREAARLEWQTCLSDVTAIVERRGMIERRLQTVAGLLHREADSPEDPATIERLHRIDALAKRSIGSLTEHLETLRVRQAELRIQAGDAGTQLSELTQRERTSESARAEADKRISRLSIEEAELRVRAESVAERLRRDADATEEQALAAERPEIESTDLAAVLRSREAELKRMGPINPLAAAEYSEMSERHGFLTAQLADLESSRNDLRTIITALEKEIHTQFLDAYAEIAAAYEEHFAVLFPGGRGRLSLSDPDNPMTSGVEIGAQPVGKKVAKMSLLSGGERSLAALAFLFSVFKARPSPFYILDEVEAALDDANLRRFIRLLDAFRANAQLLIVTHQQQTMESGDVLYGVTMEPGGSSKVIAKALDRVEQTV